MSSLFYKKLSMLIITSILLFTLIFPAEAQGGGVIAFPGAEGFGANSLGGRGGTIFEVINTNDSGAGSLRACVIAIGARTCVFKVGGLITLNTPLTITNPYITIAGQTAPGGGITLKLGTSTEIFLTQTHDVVIRYLTQRAGAGGENHNNQIAKNNTELYNIIIDHNSLSWGVDSNIETWYRVNGATIQWSIISEGLDNSTHSKGAHSKGIMIGGYDGGTSGGKGSENISVLNNLMAHNADRNPLMQLCGIAQVINNTTYNPMYTFSHQQLNCPLGESYVNWINNYHKAGLDSSSDSDLKIIPSDAGDCLAGKTYMSGNVGSTGTWLYALKDSCSTRSDIIVGVPAVAPIVSSISALTSYNEILAVGGAGNSKAISCDGNWYNRRDLIDVRVINNVKNGTGRIIDDPSQVGGWITPDTGTPCVDSDHDGMPDVWEEVNGFSPIVADSSVDSDSDGYTNIEEYLNGTNPLDFVSTSTNTAVINTSTSTLTFTPSFTLTFTNTPTITQAYTRTLTPTQIITNTSTSTSTPTNILTNTQTMTPTRTQTPTQTKTQVVTVSPTTTPYCFYLLPKGYFCYWITPYGY